jgi:hypothetical protein
MKLQKNKCCKCGTTLGVIFPMIYKDSSTFNAIKGVERESYWCCGKCEREWEKFWEKSKNVYTPYLWLSTFLKWRRKRKEIFVFR